MLYPSPIFGPIHSRRLGISLGINLMPEDGKLCSFDCIYCECGFNADNRPTLRRPTLQEVEEKLRLKLSEMHAEGQLPDVLTFAGNGEPTLHPDFPAIIESTRRLRDAYCPDAKISVLSNATTVCRPDVHAALLRVDNNIQKLDTVDLDFIRTIDRASAAYDVEATIDALCRFGGHVIIQTMFLQSAPGAPLRIDNTTDAYVQPWLDAVARIQPQSVMAYTIDRPTPDATLCKADPDTLDAIAARVRQLGIPCSVAY